MALRNIPETNATTWCNELSISNVFFAKRAIQLYSTLALQELRLLQSYPGSNDWPLYWPKNCIAALGEGPGGMEAIFSEKMGERDKCVLANEKVRPQA